MGIKSTLGTARGRPIRTAPATRSYFEFELVHWGVCVIAIGHYIENCSIKFTFIPVERI